MSGHPHRQQARLRFASALQSALTTEEVADAFMSTVTEVVPATNIALYRLDGRSGAVLGLWTDADGKFVDEYEQYGRANDPVLDFVRLQHRPIDSDRVAAPGIWESSGARATLVNAGLAHSLEAPLTASGAFIGTINFARPASIAGFSAADLVGARLVSEQLSLATERAMRFERTGQRVSMMERALDRLPQPVIVTDLEARVLFRNRAARQGEAIAQPGERDVVAESIAEAMTEFRLRGRRVHTSSVRETADSALKIVKSYRLGDSPDAAVTMVFDCRSQDGPGRLPAWDVLSRREQEIAQLVSEGLTTKQIAARAFISENTVKQHLKRVFAKTDVRNRAELVQLIWSAGNADQEAED